MDPITIAMGLAQFAPQIVRWLSGSEKAEEVAQKVVEVAQTVTGAGTPQDALAAINADPQVAVEFRKEIMAREVELDKAFLADRADARSRDVELVKVTGQANQRANMMVLIDAIGLIGALCALMLLGWFQAHSPDKMSEGVFGALLAQLSTMASFFGLCLRDAHAFEFGSSRGSRDKDDLLARVAEVRGHD